MSEAIDRQYRQVRLINGLLNASAYPHPVEQVRHIETHISHILLAGEFAYKVNKPLNLGFLSYLELSQRRHYCEEELRLNSRTAPEIYLDVVAIAGPPDTPHIVPIETPDCLDRRERVAEHEGPITLVVDTGGEVDIDSLARRIRRRVGAQG